MRTPDREGRRSQVSDAADIQARNLNGCNQSAAEVQGFIDGFAAVAPVLDYPALLMACLRGEAYSEGIEPLVEHGYAIRVYGIAKTITGCFRFRHTIGLDVASKHSRMPGISANSTWTRSPTLPGSTVLRRSWHPASKPILLENVVATNRGLGPGTAAEPRQAARRRLQPAAETLRAREAAAPRCRLFARRPLPAHWRAAPLTLVRPSPPTHTRCPSAGIRLR